MKKNFWKISDKKLAKRSDKYISDLQKSLSYNDFMNAVMNSPKEQQV
jgi:hypothetical protein